MITIYHNARCSKSRDGVCFLEENNVPFQVISYLQDIPTASEIKELLQKLNLPAIELVRTKEAIWIEKFKGKEWSEEEIIDALITYPKLMERPIVVNGNKAVIARPKERIKEIL